MYKEIVVGDRCRSCDGDIPFNKSICPSCSTPRLSAATPETVVDKPDNPILGRLVILALLVVVVWWSVSSYESDEDAVVRLNVSLEGLSEQDYQQKISIYRELLKLSPAQYEQRTLYQKGIREALRDSDMYGQFSSWDGSHRGFVRAVELRMKDPGSFEHVKTTFRADGGDLFVSMAFRGRNGFGALVMQSATGLGCVTGCEMQVLAIE